MAYHNQAVRASWSNPTASTTHARHPTTNTDDDLQAAPSTASTAPSYAAMAEASGVPLSEYQDDLSYQDNITLMDCTEASRMMCPSRTQTFLLWFVRDSAGIFAAVFTWLLIIGGEMLLIFGVLVHFHNGYYAFLQGGVNLFFAMLATAAHLRTMFSDPVSEGFSV